MGFRHGSYAKIWEVKEISNTLTRCRISISFKNKQSGEYEQDFSGYVAFVGTGCASQASALHEGDRIKIGDCDTTTKYDKEKKTTFYNFKVFSFEKQEDDKPSGHAPDSGEVDEPVDDSSLPF